MPLLSDAAVKAIQDSQKTETIEVGGEVYTTRPVHAPPHDPIVAPLHINTLDGLCGYVAKCLTSDTASDGPFRDKSFIQVQDHHTVVLAGPAFGRFRQREFFVIADAYALTDPDDRFEEGRWYDLETFNVLLQSRFVGAFDRDRVLSIIGTIRDETVNTTSDDGVTQTVKAKSGIVLTAEVAVPNPVLLAPFRTFQEVDQPSSLFVLRLRRGTGPGSLPTAALFLADGGKWKLDAIANIAEYLKERMPAMTVIA